MMRQIMAALVLAAFAAPAWAQAPPGFAAGQVWTLKDASPEARFFIVQVDEGPRIIHGFAESPMVVDGRTSSFRSAHLALSEDAAKRSLDTLERTGAPRLDEVKETFAEWKRTGRRALDVTVAEKLAYAEKVIRNIGGQ